MPGGEDVSRNLASDPEEFGPYLVYEQLGIGGMATVHRAKKRGIAGFERGVALKRMLPHLSEDADFIASFVREAKLASLLVHPNIAQIYDFGRIGDVYFIAMEHVDGVDMAKLLRYCHRRGERLPLSVVFSILFDLCGALDYAHTFVDEHGQRLGIIHRDVSPSNLIVTQTGHLKVIDFGIAKASAHHLYTDSGDIQGKMGYMPPEVVIGRPVGPASDVFSVGVVAHELLTVQRLFHAKTDFETLRRVREAAIPPPSRMNPGVPEALDRLVLAALERDIARRLPSAGEFRKVLEQVAAAAGIRFSSSDVAEWLAKVESDDTWAIYSAPPGVAPDAAPRALPRPAAPISRPPTHLTEMSGSQPLAPVVDRGPQRTSADPPGPAQPESAAHSPAALSVQTATAPVIPRPRPGSRRARAVIAVAALCAIVAAITIHRVVQRPRPVAEPVALSTPSPPSPPPPALVTVKFVVRPADALVAIAGKEVSRSSPFEIAIERGVYPVAVSRPGYKRWTSQLPVRDASQTIHVALEPAAARVSLRSQPEGLTARLDGVPLDHATPLEFEAAPGPHQLVVAGATGAWSQRFVAEPGGTYTFHAALPGAKRAAAAVTSSASRPRSPASERPWQRDGAEAAGRTAPASESAAEPTAPAAPIGPAPAPPAADEAPPPRPAAAPPPSLPRPSAAVSQAPALVAASAVIKLSGEIPSTIEGRVPGGSADVFCKICIAIDGHVTSVKVIKASAAIADELQRALLRWRYKPYLDDAGLPSPACFAVKFRMVFKRAD